MSTQPLFRAAKQNRIFQDVVDQIQEAIIDGKLREGERLPPERELKEMLSVSRSTLREALRVLEQKGLIEIRLGTGGGAMVKSMSADQVIESLDLLIRSQKVSLNHLAEFRERTEGDVVELAADRAEAKDIRHLKKLLQNAKHFVDGGAHYVVEFLRADRELHLAFAKISGNPVYVSVLKTVHENIHRYYERLLAMEDREMMENYQDLCNIVAAVEEGEARSARQLVIDHVRRFTQYMKKHE